MAIEYKWKIERLDCYPTADNEVDVVTTVHWRLTGEEGDFFTYVYGSVNVPFNAGAPFTPYDQLTQEQVVGWVKAALPIGEDDLPPEEVIRRQIEAQKNPPLVTLPPPWEQAPEVVPAA